ncbi:MAG: ABC transporter ATP-binding protein [Pirellulaceae bacterium]|nr:ABC transporter ATP-binding protein [Pirellulaceae bacterium]
MTDDVFEGRLAEEDPELYGLLLLANQKISNVGTSAVWLCGIAALGLCVALHMKWLDDLTGIDFDNARGWGVYFLICTTAFALFAFWNTAMERSAYRKMRDDVFESLRRSDRSVYNLITAMQNDEALKNIAEHVKDDPGVKVSARPGDAVRM